MKSIFNNEEIEILSSDKLDYINELIVNATKEKFNFYRKLFEVDKLEKIRFVIYDSLDEFRNDYIENNKKELPEYSRGYFNSKLNTSYIVIDKLPIVNTPLWYKKIYTNSHEAFHIFYKKYIYNDDRIVWFDEGLAQFLSGENDNWIYDEDKLRENFILYNALYKPITNLNDRIQGNNSIPDDLIFKRDNIFDGYRTSLFIIKYLEETKGMDFIFDLMKNNNKIRKLGGNIIEEMRNYFLKKYNLI